MDDNTKDITRRAIPARRVRMENGTMPDILMLAIGLGAFALLALYGIASERL